LYHYFFIYFYKNIIINMSSNKSKFNNKYKQGFYKLQNSSKYLGDPTKIVFRSSWEYAFCTYLDMNDSILKWSCEQPIITYQDLRNKTHRYYPDFYYQMCVNGDPHQYKQVIVEIKPESELYPPKRPLNETAKALENYEYAVRTHVKNKLKWNAAIDYAKNHNAEFIIITEKHLKQKGLLR